ncbi:S-adenosyl-L-methionine-dependent methyltransferase [Synechococcus sp. PROS-9-1]|uniref:class I SAM-dependent methyltransferase n=1 Tax=Synechococcus sp. PROS-9-1 TaxID=1968775 RepID=UPI001646EB1B|nr:class I SAM-dependent methyltransferase [Synechococcus sp. PROS-9-1]QNJ31790.1 S-adenosyl-L-methionine-dependent methyltransferase [Synechococcus sp. PROS-9-1]
MIWGAALNNRDRQPEVMDQPGLDPKEHAKALMGLRRINAISRCSAGLFRPIEALAITQPAKPLRVLELACGGGDTAIDLALMAKRKGLSLDIHACDLNPEAVAIAQTNAVRRQAALTVFTADALAKPTDRNSFDVVYCTLFAHHLDELDVVRLLEVMALRSRKLVLVDDLIRSRLGFALAWIGTRLLSRSWVVHTDGLLSVRAALQPDEMKSIAMQAGLKDAQIKRSWPERYLLNWAHS